MEKWTPATIWIASDWGPTEKDAHNYRGISIFLRPSRISEMGPHWSVTHTNTGHMVCMLPGNWDDIIPIATALAECADWSFIGLDGWRNQDPELPAKFKAVLASHGVGYLRTGQINDGDMARDIAEMNAA